MKRIGIFSIVILFVFHLANFSPAQGQPINQVGQNQKTQNIIDEYVASLPEQAEVAIGIIQGDQIFRQGYLIQNGKATPIENSHRIFEIGSITKTFTGLLLLQEVADGAMKLDDPITQYLPEITGPNLKTVTLRHLVTHSSGLSDGPASIILPALRGMLFNKENPHRFIKWKHYLKYLSKDDLDTPAGEIWNYNNAGIALLGKLLALKNERTWEQLVHEKIFSPLSMNNTFATSKAAPTDLLVQGYNRKGKQGTYWDMDFINPAGSIKSNVDDMLKYLAAHLNASEGSAYDLAKAKYNLPIMGGKYLQGNAWFHRISEEEHLVWGGGATGSFKAHLSFDESRKTAIVMLSNFSVHHPQMKDEQGRGSMRQYGFKIMESLSTEVEMGKVSQAATKAF